MAILLKLFGNFMITLGNQHFEYIQGIGDELFILLVVVEHLLDGSKIVESESNRNDLLYLDIYFNSEDQIHPRALILEDLVVELRLR